MQWNYRTELRGTQTNMLIWVQSGGKKWEIKASP